MNVVFIVFVFLGSSLIHSLTFVSCFICIIINLMPVGLICIFSHNFLPSKMNNNSKKARKMGKERRSKKYIL